MTKSSVQFESLFALVPQSVMIWWYRDNIFDNLTGKFETKNMKADSVSKNAHSTLEMGMMRTWTFYDDYVCYRVVITSIKCDGFHIITLYQHNNQNAS